MNEELKNDEVGNRPCGSRLRLVRQMALFADQSYCRRCTSRCVFSFFIAPEESTAKLFYVVSASNDSSQFK